MKRLLLIFFLFVGFAVQAQTVQWASKVVEFSSELTPVQYSAQQLLGKPDVLPAGGESPNAWTPERANKKEFVRVGFDTPMKIRQIAIAESFNPSALFKVYAYDPAGNEYLVNTFSPRTVPLNGRMLNIVIEETTFEVAELKLEFDGGAVPEYYSIDAIGISDSDIPIVAQIDVTEGLNPELYKERLSENVNSQYKEYRPLLSPDGQTLYFSRQNHPENIGGSKDVEDIWYSELGSDGEWQAAKNIGPSLNNKGPNFISSVTPDGKTVLLGNRYLKNGKMAAGVSISTNTSGEWSTPIALEIENDYNYSERANFYLANNRKVLMMSVQRDDSYGARDLYVSFMNDDSTWTEPKNLGGVVNTAGEDTAPFLAPDDKTLYFSSNGFAGFGGSDIYVTRRLDDTWQNWSEPENLGPTINSQYEDLYFNIPGNSDFAYYSQGVSSDDTDIFRVAMPLFKRPDPVILVKGITRDSKSNNPIGARIVYERLSDGEEVGLMNSNPTSGEYEVMLPAGQLYGIRADAEGYVSINENLDLREFDADADRSTETKDLYLAPIETGVTVVLNNIFFDFDKSDLKKESFPELDRVVELLNDRETLTIDIAGHTDNIGPDAYNLQLSQRRAQAVYNYLVEKGVSQERIQVKYYGESKPIATNDTVEGRRENRRVEFIITND